MQDIFVTSMSVFQTKWYETRLESYKPSTLLQPNEKFLGNMDVGTGDVRVTVRLGSYEAHDSFYTNDAISIRQYFFIS